MVQMTKEIAYLDPLTSCILRIKLTLESLLAGNPYSFGCSDFYPLPGTTNQQPGDQGAVVEDRRSSSSGSARATNPTSSASKRTKSKYITPGKQRKTTSKRISPTSNLQEEEEDTDSDDNEIAYANNNDSSSDDIDSDEDQDDRYSEEGQPSPESPKPSPESPKQQSKLPDLADLLINKGGKLTYSEQESIRLIQQHYNDKLENMAPSTRSGRASLPKSNPNNGKSQTSSTKKQAKKARKAADSDDEDLEPTYKNMYLEMCQKHMEKEAEINECSWGKLTKTERKDRTNKAQAQLVKSQTIHIWRTVKFINNESELMKVIKDVMTMCNLAEHNLMLAKDEKQKEKIMSDRAKFMGTYKEIVRVQINDKRSYVSVSQYCIEEHRFLHAYLTNS